MSRVVTGKKNIVTVRKIKKQRRILCDTMVHLHKKFTAEHKHVSYSFFCAQRPFWVTQPKEADRDTCLCKTHENLQYMADKLFSLGILTSKNLEEMADATVCDMTKKECAYGQCKECKMTTCSLFRSPQNKEINLTQWSLEKISHENGCDSSTVTIKKEIAITEDELVTQFQDRLFNFRGHIFNIRWQYSMYRKLRENLGPNECLIHVDFSENYSCKYAKEIQAVHFGGSHKQATLHTGVLYVQAEPAPVPFCTISPSRRHDPPSIWAHLDPVLKMIQENHPDVTCLHFFSDGPASQYKQKANFHLLSTVPFEKGFSTTTWNFFEASHGKGAPDGIGGTLKRTADNLVRQGQDLPDAESLFYHLKNSGSVVRLFYVGEEDVDAWVQMMEVQPLSTIKGTMKIHQVVSTEPGFLKYRDISCFCQAEQGVYDCPCYALQEASLSMKKKENPATTKQSSFDGSLRPEVIESKHIGQWCVLNYDEQPYPGIIQEVENHNIKIKCMHRNGINKFFWPSPRDDIHWYSDDQVICFIPVPLPVNKRSVQINHDIWEYLQEHYEI